MKLLIVDDQYVSAKGLSDGINWNKIGIDNVRIAQNAMEARLCFKDHVPDIVLCDIEMPVETGLDLIRWVRSEGYESRVIFLTCHAEFQYAKEAIALNVDDYIVQPAPYENIQRVVEKVIKLIKQKNEKQQYVNMGELYDKQKRNIRSSILLNYINGGIDDHAFNAFPGLWNEGDMCCLILIQVVGLKNPQEEPWDVSLLLSAITNYVEEIFEPGNYMHVTAAIQADTFCVALKGLTPTSLNEENIMLHLQYLHDAFELYMPQEIACYASDPCSPRELHSAWQKLLSHRDANVAHNSGVFSANNKVSKFDKHVNTVQHAANWKTLIQDSNFVAAEALITKILDDMIAEDKMTADSLLSFYQSFMQFVYENTDAKQIFSSPEAIELYRNGMKTVPDMKLLIHYVLEHYKRDETLQNAKGHKEIVQYVKNYIQNNMETCARVEDLARVVYLSADHLNKIFKKETGLTLKAYLLQEKMKEAKTLLKNTNLPVSYIAAKLGYTNFSHFSFTYKKEMGLTPLEERENV